MPQLALGGREELRQVLVQPDGKLTQSEIVSSIPSVPWQRIPERLRNKHFTYVRGFTDDGRDGHWRVLDTPPPPGATVPLCSAHKDVIDGVIVGIGPYDGSDSVARLLLAAEALDDDIVLGVLEEIVHGECESELEAQAFLEMLAVAASEKDPVFFEDPRFVKILEEFKELYVPAEFGKCVFHAETNHAQSGDAERGHVESLGRDVGGRMTSIERGHVESLVRDIMLKEDQLLVRAAPNIVENLDGVRRVGGWMASISTAPAYNLAPDLLDSHKGYQGLMAYGDWLFLLEAEKAVENGALGHPDDGWTVNGLSVKASIIAARLGVGKGGYFDGKRFKISKTFKMNARFESALEKLAPEDPDDECDTYASFHKTVQNLDLEDPALAMRFQYNYDEVWCAAAPAASLVGVMFNEHVTDIEKEQVAMAISRLRLDHPVEMLSYDLSWNLKLERRV